MNKRIISGPQVLRHISELGLSNNPREDKADITNAATLFGDPYGDIEDGDLYGDYEDGDLYGDINDDTLSAFNMISGDPGSKNRHMSNAMRFGLGAAGAAGVGAITTAAIRKHLRKKQMRKEMIKSQMANQRVKQTLQNQKIARDTAGKIDRKKRMPFFQVSGAKMNSSPIEPMSAYVADMFKHNLDRQASDTPFLAEIVPATFAAGTWTATTIGVATNRFFTGLIVQIGMNALTGVPATVFNMTMTVPTINGPLVIAATPFSFTFDKGFDSKFLFFPWQLVQTTPLPVLGQYNAVTPITIAITGLTATDKVTLVVPGSQHPWTVQMRNSLITV